MNTKQQRKHRNNVLCVVRAKAINRDNRGFLDQLKNYQLIKGNCIIELFNEIPKDDVNGE
jgi:hypothetical protein